MYSLGNDVRAFLTKLVTAVPLNKPTVCHVANSLLLAPNQTQLFTTRPSDPSYYYTEPPIQWLPGVL
jgi:hypothetical protein